MARHSTRQALLTLRPWFSGSYRHVFVAVLAPVASGLALWGLARVTQTLLNQAAGDESGGWSDWLIYGIVAVAAPIFGALGGLSSSIVGRRVELGAVSAVLSRTLQLHTVEAYNSMESHDTIERAVQGVKTGTSQLLTAVSTFIQAATTVAAFTASLIFLGRWIGVALALVGLANLAVKIGLQAEAEELQAKNSSFERRRFYTYFILSATRYAQELRLFSLGKRIHSELDSSSEHLESTERKLAVRRFSRQSGLYALDALVTAIVVVVLITRIEESSLPPGDLTFFLAAIAAIQRGFESGMSAFANLLDAFRYFRRYDEFEELMDSNSGPTDVVPFSGSISSIELVDVWFRYNEEGPWVLEGVDLVLEAGRNYGLIGDNGSGKSTLIALILGLYEPTKGKVLVNGEDLAEIDKNLFWSHVSSLFQEFGRYEMTLKDNVVGGRQMDDDLFERSLRGVGVSRLVEQLPSQENTFLGTMFGDPASGGSELSGGQWQLVAAARATYGSSGLVVLDEPTSSMDAAAEARFIGQIQSHHDEGIRLLVSHRMNVILDMDVVLVMHSGAIRESGQPLELIESNGYFAERFALQAAPIVRALEARQ